MKFRSGHFHYIMKEEHTKKIKKIRRCLKINVKFVVIYDTKKISFYCNVEDKVPHEQRNNIVYRVRCPGCGGEYIGITERCLISRMNEHGTDTCRNV